MVRATHPRTLEVTTDPHLTSRGDCIIGVGADKGASGLSPSLKDLVVAKGSRVTVIIRVEGYTFSLRANGDPRLTLSHPQDIVVRTTNFPSDRTLALNSDLAARDVPRDMVRLLRNEETVGSMEITAFA